MRIVIIDYGSGNLRSVHKALAHVTNDREIIVSSSAQDVLAASHIVLPGVGAFGDCINGLSALPGMRDALEENVRQKQKPFLGICVGMQMLLEKGHEHGTHAGLGWIKGEVRPLQPGNAQLKIPHMGWNELTITRQHPLLKGIENGEHVYFVHSFHADCPSENRLVEVDYGGNIAAIIAEGNIMGTQFHPEKSGDVGLALLKNFVGL